MKPFLFLALWCIATSSAVGQTGWTNLGPHGGLIDAVVADYTSPGTLIAGTQTGDFYRSVNDGQSWSYLSALPSTGNDAIARLIIDTANGLRLYTATNNQIYSSADGGTTWVPAANGEVQEVFDMAISPVNASQLYASASDKIWRSLNYGLSWSAVYEAEDTVEVTAFAFAPNNPQNRFYIGLQTDAGLAKIVGTDNGGIGTFPLLQLSQDWIVAKIFVASDPSATVMALVGSGDSTMILRSTNGGSSWNTVYASANPLHPDNIKLTFYNWIAWRDDEANQVVGTPSGLLYTSNNGTVWSNLFYPSEVFTTTLARSPLESATLYGRAVGHGAGLSKIILNPGGSISLTDINYGLTATRIERVYFADGNDLILSNNTNELMISQNGGFDFNRFGLGQGAQVMTAYKSRIDETYYWITQAGDIYLSETGISSELADSIPFSPPYDKVLSASALSYYDETSDGDSTLVVASAGNDALTSGTVLLSVDDGANWRSINYAGPFSATIPRQVSVDFASLIHIYVSNDQGIFRHTYKGTPTWTPTYVAPAGHTIIKFASRSGDLLFILIQTPASSQRLEVSFFDPQTAGWQSFDISYTLDQIDPSGHGVVEDIYAGDDANYLLYHFPEGPRRLYKANFYGDIVWHDITESPLDQLNIRSILDDNDYEDQSFNLYAAADNGIWVLKQTAILSQDTAVTSPPTSVNIQDTSWFVVSYRNDGSAVATVDSFRITGDLHDEFGFADPSLSQTTYPVFYPLDLRSTTPITLYFAPTRFGTSQAVLTAYYRGRSSRGVDSVFSLTTRLTGLTSASRISTGLRGDTLEMRGTLIYGSKTSLLPIGNSGNDTLYVFDARLANGTYFEIELPDEIGTDGYVAIPPNQLSTLPVTFRPVHGGLHVDSVVIVSSAHHFLTNTPDYEHIVTVTGTGSMLDVTNLAALRPQLGQNQGVTINLSIAQLTATDVTSTLYYRQIGQRSAGFSSVSFTPAAGQAGFVAVIPPDEITQNGLEFYIDSRGSTAQGGVSLYFPDASRSDSTYSLVITIPRPGLGSSGYLSLPGGTKGEAFQMVSFPISLNNNTPQGAFGESNLGQIGDDGDWQLYRYDDPNDGWIRATDGDISFGNIESGRSYMVITRTPRTLNSGAGKTLTPDQAHMTISPGWNMIANPYAFSINWLDVALFNDRIEYGEIVTLQNGRFRYVEDSELGTLLLEPWKGYFYYSNPDSGTFDLYYPAASAAGPAKQAQPVRHRAGSLLLTSDDYVLDLKLTYDSYEIHHRVGELADASEVRDRFDKAALPTLSNEDIVLTFSDGYHSDFRPLSEEGRHWDFKLSNASGTTEGILSIDGVESLPKGFLAVLIDRDRNQAVDLRHMPIRATGRDRNFQLLVGTAAFIEKSRAELIPTSFYLDRNYPNPFNPSTLIRYGLPAGARVNLAVYNMLGQKVRTLINQTQTAGVFSIPWDGRNDTGHLAASGVYIYRLSAVSLDGARRFTQSNKMTLLK